MFGGEAKADATPAADLKDLHAKIGQLALENELPVSRQASVLGISRGSVYYLPRAVDDADLALMRRIDELHLDYPFAAEPMLNGADHQIADILALDAFGDRDMPHGFAITAIEGKGDADILLVVAGDLEAIRVPTRVGMINRNPAIMTALFRAAAWRWRRRPCTFMMRQIPLPVGRRATLSGVGH